MNRSWRTSGRTGDDGDDSDDGGGGGEEDRRELMNFEFASTKDIVLFCIDAGPHMHQTNPDTGTSYLHEALLAACRVQESKLIKSPYDIVGILLFGTAKTNVQDLISRGTAYTHCLILNKMAQVDVVPISEVYDILSLDALGECPLSQVNATAPLDKPFYIEHALGNAVHYLMAHGKTGHKRIFFMTNDDNPASKRRDLKRVDIQKKCLEFVKEAGKRNIEIEPLFIGSSEHDFELDKFYAEVFAAYDDELLPVEVSNTDETESDSDDSDEEDERLQQMLGLKPPPSEEKKAKKAKAAEKFDGQTRREQREARNRRLYDCATRVEELSQALEERQMPKRVVFNSVMEVIEGIHVGVKGYAMFARAARGTPVRMIADGDNYQEVAVKAVPVCEDTEQILDGKRDFETAFSFGAAGAAAKYSAMQFAEGGGGDGADFAGPSAARGDDAPTADDTGSSMPARGLAKFSKDEIREMREMGVPHGIRILGFKPQIKLQSWMNTKHAVFLYPSDEMRPGSKRFFASLLHSMSTKKVYGLALCLPRTGMTPFFAAIWPREEEIREDGAQTAAPGMFMIPLPFADDMRDKPWEPIIRARPEEVAAAKKMVKQFTNPKAFKPDHYENPALALHYATIRAKAFDRELPTTTVIGQARAKVEEELKVKRESQQPGMDLDEEASSKRTAMAQKGSLLDQIRNPEKIEDQTLPGYSEIEEVEEAKPTIKRFNALIEESGHGSAKGAALKFKKKDEAALRERWQSGTLSKLKVTDLKAAMTFYKLPQTGVKQELIDRLSSALELRFGG